MEKDGMLPMCGQLEIGSVPFISIYPIEDGCHPERSNANGECDPPYIVEGSPTRRTLPSEIDRRSRISIRQGFLANNVKDVRPPPRLRTELSLLPSLRPAEFFPRKAQAIRDTSSISESGPLCCRMPAKEAGQAWNRRRKSCMTFALLFVTLSVI